MPPVRIIFFISTIGMLIAATKWTNLGQTDSGEYQWNSHGPMKMQSKRIQSIPGLFTAQRQFKDGVSPFPLMPGSVSCRKDFEHMVNGYDTAIAYRAFSEIIERLIASL